MNDEYVEEMAFSEVLTKLGTLRMNVFIQIYE